MVECVADALYGQASLHENNWKACREKTWYGLTTGLSISAWPEIASAHARTIRGGKSLQQEVKNTCTKQTR